MSTMIHVPQRQPAITPPSSSPSPSVPSIQITNQHKPKRASLPPSPTPSNLLPVCHSPCAHTAVRQPSSRHNEPGPPLVPQPSIRPQHVVTTSRTDPTAGSGGSGCTAAHRNSSSSCLKRSESSSFTARSFDRTASSPSPASATRSEMISQESVCNPYDHTALPMLHL